MITVTGATGNVGRPLVQALAAAGHDVRAVSRKQADLPEGVRHVTADLTDPQSLGAALSGSDAVFLLLSGEVMGSGTDPAGVVEAVKAAAPGRVVLLSSQGAGTRPDAIGHNVLGAFEQALAGSGLETTVLRPGGFASNAYAWIGSVRSERTVAAPFAQVGLPVVDPADIAEVAAAALTGTGHAGRTYELTGPAAVTPREQAKAIGDAIGEDVRFVELTREEARAGMLQFMPEPVVEGTLDILGTPVPQEQRVSPDVQEVLGRAPRTFAEWAARNAPAFR